MNKLCALNGFLEVNATGNRLNMGFIATRYYHVNINHVNVKNAEIAFDHLNTCFRKYTVQILHKKCNECEGIRQKNKFLVWYFSKHFSVLTKLILWNSCEQMKRKSKVKYINFKRVGMWICNVYSAIWKLRNWVDFISILFFLAPVLLHYLYISKW